MTKTRQIGLQNLGTWTSGGGTSPVFNRSTTIDSSLTQSIFSTALNIYITKLLVLSLSLSFRGSSVQVLNQPCVGGFVCSSPCMHPPNDLLLALAKDDKHLLLRPHVAGQSFAQQRQPLSEKPAMVNVVVIGKTSLKECSTYLAPACSWSSREGITLVLCSRTTLFVLLN